MSVAEPVISHSANVEYDQRELNELLLACQSNLEGQNSSVIVSFSQVINSVDPLSLLSYLTGKQQTLTQANELSFYWENQRKQESILGYGITQSLSLNTVNRFRDSQKFVESCLKKILRVGDYQIAESLPHFFCGYTFFSRVTDLTFPFPSA
ncbi:MAG: isochorismate synthase, partial [Cyanobacteria bacterium P01_G01_bin.49]